VEPRKDQSSETWRYEETRLTHHEPKALRWNPPLTFPPYLEPIGLRWDGTDSFPGGRMKIYPMNMILDRHLAKFGLSRDHARACWSRNSSLRECFHLYSGSLVETVDMIIQQANEVVMARIKAEKDETSEVP